MDGEGTLLDKFEHWRLQHGHPLHPDAVLIAYLNTLPSDCEIQLVSENTYLTVKHTAGSISVPIATITPELRKDLRDFSARAKC